jgi:diphthamide synthase (EF-2-diphthine--ammonia ligase)
MEGYYSQGYRKVIFGDIFLEDVRTYREENLGKVGMEAVFPLWGKDSRDLADAFIEGGFKAITTCVDSQVLGKDFAGRGYTKRFLEDLPPGADPCGENGEFHTFVYGGPIFNREVPFSPGEIVLRDNRFFYCDLIGK